MTPDEKTVRTELRDREPLFHRPGQAGSWAEVCSVTAPDYWEIGASGRRYDREFIWSVLQERHHRDPAGRDDVWAVDDFAVRSLAGDCYLATYTLRQESSGPESSGQGRSGQRVSRRSTIWQRADHGWQAIYHQGTLVAGE
ncbi:MAG: DUF4440 domain-containing protein, partial [Gordonia sp. (in: high G+C Gram-positive bacteria)]